MTTGQPNYPEADKAELTAVGQHSQTGRQIELRANCVVVGARASARFNVRTPAASQTHLALNCMHPLKRRERRAPIPTGLRPPAQGCEERATLGQHPASLTNRNAVAAIPSSFAASGIGHNPVGVGKDFIPSPQGSSCVATLGYMPESRWDSPKIIASTTFAGVSFQPPAQFGGISSSMPNGQNLNLAIFPVNNEINGMRPGCRHFCLPNPAQVRPETLRPLRESVQECPQRVVKSQARSRGAFLIPYHRLMPFLFGFGFRNDVKRHFATGKRFLISADTSSMGVPRPGCASASFARRSSSVICSGESSSSAVPNSNSIVSKSSRRSASGIRRSSSRISIALMPLIYPLTGAMQMKTPPRSAALLP